MLEDTFNRKKIELRFRCKDLPSKSFLDKSDPYILVECLVNGIIVPIGKTEVVAKEPNPVFEKPVLLPHCLEDYQELTFTIYDEEGENDIMLGMIKCKTSDLIATPDPKCMDPSLPEAKKQCYLEVAWQVIEISKKNYEVDCHTEYIKDTSLFEFSSPFIRFSCPKPEFKNATDPKEVKKWILASETEDIKEDLNVKFETLYINEYYFCHCSVDTLVKVEIWDRSPKGHNERKANAFTTVKKLQAGERCLVLKGTDDKPIGTLVIDYFEEYFDYDLKDYLKSGLQMDLTFAVDFTASNGPIKSQLSLHHISKSNPDKFNEYQSAIQAVGNMLIKYDDDSEVTAYGFGAKINGQFLDVFALSFDIKACTVNSIDALLATYYQAVPKVELFGPTNFAPIIYTAREKAIDAYNENKWQYGILIILTDGLVTDMKLTKEAIVACCNEPLSIIIIGIGGENFKEMRVLDSKQRPIKGSTRDLVTFVRYRDCENDPERLARNIFKELPSQIDKFYRKKKIKPF